MRLISRTCRFRSRMSAVRCARRLSSSLLMLLRFRDKISIFSLYCNDAKEKEGGGQGGAGTVREERGRSGRSGAAHALGCWPVQALAFRREQARANAAMYSPSGARIFPNQPRRDPWLACPSLRPAALESPQSRARRLKAARR